MSRFFISSEQINGNSITLTGENYTHLCHVLRAKKGDKITACDGLGTDYIGVVDAIDKSKASIKIIEKQPNLAEPSIDVTLFFGALKGDKNDLVVQKTVELGVKNIRPFISRFVQVKPQSIKLDRLNKIILEASKQCGRGVLPLIHAPIELNEVLKKLSSFDFVLFASEHESNTDILSCLQSIKKHASIAIIVGSEGGFDSDEVEALIKNGANSVTLGTRILRAETASISILSILMYQMGQMKL